MRAVSLALAALAALCSASRADFEARGAVVRGDHVILRGIADPGSTAPRVWEGDTELEVLGMEWLEAAPRIIFVIDCSGSAGRLHRPLRAAVRRFLAYWPEAEAAVVAFGSDARVVVPPTQDHAAVDAAFETLQPMGKNAISSGVALGLTLADGHPRAMMVVMTDSFDTPGPVTLPVALDAARCVDAPIYGLGIGNRVEMPLLNELASASGGRARAIDTPLEAGPFLEELAVLLREREARLTARLASTEPFSAHSFSVGDAPDGESPLIAYGPWPAGRGQLRLPVLRADGTPYETPVLVRVGDVPVALGKAGSPIAVPPADLTVTPCTVPPMDPIECRLADDQATELPPITLGALSVAGPELGLTDGTPVAVLHGGEPVLLMSTHEWAAVLPGNYRVEVRTAPPWRSPEVRVEAGGQLEVIAPELGELLVEVTGPDGEPIPTTLRILTPSGQPAGTARSGRTRSLPAGPYQVVVPLPPERVLQVEVLPDQVNTLRLSDYGELRVMARGPFGEDLDLGLTIYDLDGQLLVSSRTGRSVALAAGQYAIAIDSVPPYRYRPVTVTGGEYTLEDVRVFGGLFVAGGDGGRYRLEEAKEGQLIGRFMVGETLVLLAGDYSIEALDSVSPPLPVTVRAGMVTRVDLP